MNTERIYSVAIIGGGAAGVMALNRSVLNNLDTVFFSGNAKTRKKSRALWVKKVENMPGFLEFSKGIENSNHQMLEWLRQKPWIDKWHDGFDRTIVSIAKNSKNVFEITDHLGEVYHSKFVVLCTGMMDRQPVIGGSIRPILPYANLQQVDYCLRCDGHHTIGKKTVVIGHSNSAAWVSIMLHERYQPPSMTILTHGEKPEFDASVLALLQLYNIAVITDEIGAIHKKNDDSSRCLESFELKNGKVVAAEIAFVSLGVMVYNELALQLNLKVDQRGFVETNEVGETSLPHCYVAGDLRANKKKQIYTAWDMAVDTVDHIDAIVRLEKRRVLQGLG